jgi:hypothetical protein
MYVFWWSGRGYYTVIVVLGVLTAFGLLAAVGIPDGPLFWAVALLAAAALNWHFGSKINRKKLAALKPRSVKSRLFYRAHHRFMSVPMETFSLVLIAGSVGWLIYRLGSAG